MRREPTVRRHVDAAEIITSERCWIRELWNDASDPDVSVARARVEPGVTTQLHALDVDERYLIITGSGSVKAGDLPWTPVGEGDVVLIPRGAPQSIRNTGPDDLVFDCVCSPRFEAAGYHPMGP